MSEDRVAVDEADVTAMLERVGFSPADFHWPEHHIRCHLNSIRSTPFRRVCSCGDQTEG